MRLERKYNVYFCVIVNGGKEVNPTIRDGARSDGRAEENGRSWCVHGACGVYARKDVTRTGRYVYGTGVKELE